MSRIIDSRRKDKPYGTLDFGTIFEMDGKFYIKSNILEEDSEPDTYSVNLESGAYMNIGCDVMVTPCDAEITLVR